MFLNACKLVEEHLESFRVF